jgi:hypothetical protein
MSVAISFKYKQSRFFHYAFRCQILYTHTNFALKSFLHFLFGLLRAFSLRCVLSRTRLCSLTSHSTSCVGEIGPHTSRVLLLLLPSTGHRPRNPTFQQSTDDAPNQEGRPHCGDPRLCVSKLYRPSDLLCQYHSYVASLSIRVLVGAEESGMKEFTVHEDLICPRSQFFRKAMSGPWKESEERKVDLPEDEPGVFALYLKLI